MIRAATDTDWRGSWPFLADIVAAVQTYAYLHELGTEKAGHCG